MSFWKSLFGGGGSPASADKPSAPIEYNGFIIRAAPFKDEGQYMAGPGKPPVKVTEKDADIIWKYDMMDELGVFPHNASNCSVTILGDRVYTCTSNGQDWTHSNIPSPNSPSFIALDAKTGAFLGEDDAHIGPRIFHGQWSSPSLAVVSGLRVDRRELIISTVAAAKPEARESSPRNSIWPFWAAVTTAAMLMST